MSFFDFWLSPKNGGIIIVGIIVGIILLYAVVGAVFALKRRQQDKLFMSAEIDRQKAIRRTEEIRAEQRRKEEAERNLQEMMKKSVVSKSERYRFLEELSKSLNSYPLQNQYNYSVDVSSRALVDQTNADKAMMELISSSSEIVSILKQGFTNDAALSQYEERIKDLPPCEIIKEPDRLSIMYMSTEQQMTKKMIEDIRPVVPSFCLRIQYFSPAGRSYHDREVSYSIYEMFDLLRQMKKEAEYKASAKYQRSQVTESVRYNVMRRDGFRCTICGRDASDGVKLHIDHIVPVSKGGKSTMDNLRTLCEECNRGKRDKYDENGPN